LEEMVFRETVVEALGMLTPEELLMAAARVAGLGDEEMAALMGVEPATVVDRMSRAKRRIVAEVPELRVFLSDRRMPRGSRPADEAREPRPARAAGGVGEAEVYRLVEAAERLGVAEGTVALWLQERMFPGAYRVGTEWWIPAEELMGGVGGWLVGEATMWSQGERDE
jgi:hypothetical protein